MYVRDVRSMPAETSAKGGLKMAQRKSAAPSLGASATAVSFAGAMPSGKRARKDTTGDDGAEEKEEEDDFDRKVRVRRYVVCLCVCDDFADGDVTFRVRRHVVCVCVCV